MTTAQPYLLEMNSISKEFPGVKALDSVSLRIRPGTVHIVAVAIDIRKYIRKK